MTTVTEGAGSSVQLGDDTLVVIPQQDRVGDLSVVRERGTSNRAPHGPILFVGSSGGHLAQLLSLRQWWADKPHEWVTLNTQDAQSLLSDESVTWAFHPSTRNIPNLLRNTWLALNLLRRSRPSVIVSTGAAVALPFFVLGWLMRIPTVYIEVFDRIDSRTLTGRLCRPFATTFFVQWQEQLSLYRNSVLLGPLL